MLASSKPGFMGVVFGVLTRYAWGSARAQRLHGDLGAL